MKYAIGIDGGGTKTLGILADRDGRVLSRWGDPVWNISPWAGRSR